MCKTEMKVSMYDQQDVKREKMSQSRPGHRMMGESPVLHTP